MGDFLHGIQINEDDSGPRPIAGSNSAIIGLVGTAASSELKANQVILIAGSRKDVEKYGLAISKSESPSDDSASKLPPVATEPESVAGAESSANAKKKSERKATESAAPVMAADEVPVPDSFKKDSLPYALAGILDQTSALIVVIKAESDADTHIKAAIDRLKSAESVVHQCPRILVAPGFSDNSGIRDKLAEVAGIVRGVAVVDAVDSEAYTEALTDIAGDTAGGKPGISDPRVYAVYPPLTVAVDAETTIDEPASARVAGVIARSDAQRGFWYSPSNQPVKGIVGTKYPIDFALDNVNSTANRLNGGKVATIIQQNGYRLWGNRSTATDAKWQFISVRRTADLINDALLRSHLWALDRNITSTYVADVTEGVNAYLRYLKNIGAIINGRCWADPADNTPDRIQQGKVVFSFDFTPPYPAEHIVFNSRLVNDYLVEVFA
ncbi:phage tail protein [Exilibacterium tricleocarpae]|uniref:Phage tail protein n=1 Tax=Exilibacterium tricleocarpae TaxID=2591008 RepID=A0A545T5U0_9GAMM|nr:phage tail sheath C-terminal domain-containing protein [Exilibacterium tricleocarpae]TQV72583.1 phage tail protein [Exilibacterium tricleocarpae]